MARPGNEQIVEHLLPYDAEVVGRYLIGDREIPYPYLHYPRIRCSEDRRRASSYSRPSTENPALSIVEEIEVPDKPNEADARRPGGMFENARRTGISIIGGLASMVLAQTIARIMEGVNSNKLPSINQGLAMLDFCIPQMGEIHEICLGRELAGNILQYAIDNPVETLSSTMQVAPWIDEQAQGRFTDAAQDVLDTNDILPCEAEPAPLPLRKLRACDNDPDVIPDHAAEVIVSINNTTGERVLWDTDAAWEADIPGYAINVGFIPSMLELVTQYMGGDPDEATSALLYFQGAAARLLPHPAGKPLEVIYIDDNKTS